MKRITIFFACLLIGIRLFAQVPPVSEAVVVAEYCNHCGLVDYEKGERHRSDCPYVNGSSVSGGSSSSSSGNSYSLDPSITSAISSMSYAAGEAIGEAFNRAMDNYAAGSMIQYEGTRPGDQNGNFVVARNGRHGKVGMFDNGSRDRWWKIGPVYKDLKIYDLNSILATKRSGKVGVLNASGKRVQKVLPFEYDGFQTLGKSSEKGMVYALGRKVGDKTMWSIWSGHSRLIIDEFENVSITDEGIVAEVGDRYQVFDNNGRLKMIFVQQKK